MGHARVREWEKREQLQRLVVDAIRTDLDDRGLTEEEMDWVYFMVSPDLDEVFAWVNVSGREIDQAAFEGWELEYAESIEQAEEITGYYFDLR